MAEWAKEIGAITLFVEDAARSAAFYQDVFDLEPTYFDDGGACSGWSTRCSC
jgi:catechol 2,3-dioxygenase-like lactoylglutathione lyase family enzyme